MTSRRLTVRSAFAAIAAMAVAWSPANVAAQSATAEEQFTALCAACHSIVEGRRVGPDLQGIGQRRSEAWLLAFIASPQKMVSSGDPIAGIGNIRAFSACT